MTRQYGQDPILEAVCEFHFAPDSPWDLTVPGLIYEEIKDQFPNRQQCQVVNQLVINSKQGPQAKVQTIERMQFFTRDRTALVQTNKHFLAVNHLKRYPTWSTFWPMIEKGLGAYQRAAPGKILQVVLRYINRIDIPGKSATLRDYFNFYPATSDALPINFSTCIAGITSAVDDPRGQLGIQLTSIPGQGDTASMMLDIHHRLAESKGIADDLVMAWVQDAHSYMVGVFEACITDKTRELFGEPDE